MKLQRAECEVFRRLILSGSLGKCKRHCLRSGVSFSIFNGHFLYLEAKPCKDGLQRLQRLPGLQRVLRNTGTHFDKKARAAGLRREQRATQIQAGGELELFGKEQEEEPFLYLKPSGSTS